MDRSNQTKWYLMSANWDEIIPDFFRWSSLEVLSIIHGSWYVWRIT